MTAIDDVANEAAKISTQLDRAWETPIRKQSAMRANAHGAAGPNLQRCVVW